MLSLLAMLLSSTAMASYACPGQEKAREIAEMAAADMPCAESMSHAMDDQQPGMCHAHCQISGQSADTFHPPVFFHLMEIGSVLTMARVESPAVPVTSPPWLHRETGPPLPIRNCCFRI
jgi:hypothetical protein